MQRTARDLSAPRACSRHGSALHAFSIESAIQRVHDGWETRTRRSGARKRSTAMSSAMAVASGLRRALGACHHRAYRGTRAASAASRASLDERGVTCEQVTFSTRRLVLHGVEWHRADRSSHRPGELGRQPEPARSLRFCALGRAESRDPASRDARGVRVRSTTLNAPITAHGSTKRASRARAQRAALLARARCRPCQSPASVNSMHAVRCANAASAVVWRVHRRRSTSASCSER